MNIYKVHYTDNKESSTWLMPNGRWTKFHDLRSAYVVAISTEIACRRFKGDHPDTRITRVELVNKPNQIVID